MPNIILDVERSLKLSPPNYPKGVNFKKRIVTNRDNLIRHYQPRNLKWVLENMTNLKKSYQIQYLYDQPVKVGAVNEKDSQKIDLYSGYSRDGVEGQLGWDTTLIDIVEFETKRIRREFMYTENIIRAPRSGNTKADLAKGAMDAIENEEIDNTDSAIMDFLDVVAADKNERDKRVILKKTRALISPYKNMTPYAGPSANEKAAELGIPYGGLKNKNANGVIGYVIAGGNSKSVFSDATDLARKHGVGRYARIEIYGYIDNPEPSTLQGNRKEFLENFKWFERKLIENISYSTGISLDNKIWKDFKSPFVFCGFLPQSGEVNEFGNLVETGLVDEYGNPFVA